MQEALPPEQKKSSWLTTILKIIVSVAVLVYFCHNLDWAKFTDRLLHANFIWFGLAVVIFGLILLGTATRFWLLLRVQGIFLPFFYSWRLCMIGSFFNLFLPGSVSGDFVKLFYLLKATQTRKARATLVVGLDRMLGLVILLIIMAFTFPSQIHKFDTYPWITATAWALLALLFLVIAGGLSVAFIPFKKLPNSIRNLWPRVPQHQLIESLYDGYLEHLRHPRLTILAVIISFLVHLGNFIVGYTLACSLNLDVPFLEMIIIMSMVMTLTSLPISFGGHLVREGTFTLFFFLYGITPKDDPTGFACGILLLLVNIVWAIVGGIIFLTLRHTEKAVTPDLP